MKWWRLCLAVYAIGFYVTWGIEVHRNEARARHEFERDTAAVPAAMSAVVWPSWWIFRATYEVFK